jgi:serine/threonine protein kinase
MEPQKFGRYVIKGEIGRGGMATVYHAWDPRFEREVAIKVLPHEMLHDVQFRTRFEREAKTIAMLEHPAIVPVYDFGEEEGQPYFVMRYMTGGSLSDRMKLGRMSTQEAARILTHLAPALDEAHAKGIVHRDLKPGNILYDQYNDPYVSDFGIAKLSESQANVTGSAIVGTPAYMSPEQAQGESIDGRSDIYGLGVILFEMFTGQQPYHGDTPMSVVVKHITDPVPHILDIQPDLPSNLEKVVEKAMCKDRSQRYQTVKALAADLTAVANGKSPAFDQVDSTLVQTSAATRPAVEKPVQTLAETVLSKRVPAGEIPAIASQPARPKRTGLWIGLGTVGLVVIVVGLLGFRALNRRFNFFGAPIPTQTQALPTHTNPLVVPPVVDTPTSTEAPTLTLMPAPTNTLEPSPTATIPGLAVIGGSDQIAFLSDYNIFTMNVDGTGLTQVTKDNAEKRDLQWSPDGASLFFLSGKCVHYVSAADGKDTTLACFTSSSYLESFEISPSGSQVAISLDRVLYVVPFDLEALAKVRNWTNLRDMPGRCLSYGSGISSQSNQPLVKNVRWSADGTLIAANALALAQNLQRVDLILVFDISKCDSNISSWLDIFPGSRFTMVGFEKTPVIPFFSWDGQSLFLLNTSVRMKAGLLYGYNFEKKQGAPLTPLTTCCYQSPVWSTDGSQIMFAYQDIDHAGKVELYMVPYGTLGTGATYEPFDLPDGLFTKVAAAVEIALRRAK